MGTNEQNQNPESHPPATPPAEPPKENLAPGGKPWPDAFKEVVEDRNSLKNSVRQMTEQLQQLKSAEEARKAKEAESQQQQEQQKLEAEGNYKQALENTEKKWSEKYSKLNDSVTRRLVPMAISTAASQVKGLAPEVIKDLPNMVKDHVRVDPETLQVVVIDDEGKQVVDDKLNPVTLEAWLGNFVSERPYLVVDNLPASHGSTQNGGAKAGQFSFEAALNDRALMDQWEKADPEGLKKAEAEYWDPRAVVARQRKKMGVGK